MSHAAAGAIDPHHDATTSTGIPNKKLILWAFLASDCMFFGSLISTHLVYRLNPPADVPRAVDVFNIELTSFSTFVLLMSSLMMALSVAAIQKGNIKSMRTCMLTTIFFGLIFLGCQVYEFTHFVMEGLTLSSSILGSTFFVLTGTHGTHVAVGVLWLALMYIRSFQPLDGRGSGKWLAKNFVHVGVFAVAVVLSMMSILNLIHELQTDGVSATTVGTFLHEHFLIVAGALIGLIGLRLLARSNKAPVDFGVANAIDVESMGLYWHFVDIVWIVIFTAVYLLEYVPDLKTVAN